MNKMNKKDMLELGDNLDEHNMTFKDAEVDEDLVIDMAYQLGYFFIAIELIKERVGIGKDDIITILDNALVYPEGWEDE